jgi:hypothetical protein
MSTRTIALSDEHWQRISEALLDCCDEGPPGEGWKSPSLSSAIAALDAALAQPEPVRPTDEELKDCHGSAFNAEMKASMNDYEPGLDGLSARMARCSLAAARAVLARYGRPVITPIPVSERLPGPGDCDAHGWCWVLYEGYQTWTLEPPLDGSGPRGWSRPCGWTHWLPFHALPLPGQPAPAAPAP